MNEINPCPFCGGDARPVYYDGPECKKMQIPSYNAGYNSNFVYPGKRGTIKCKKCGQMLPRIYNKVSKAIDVWNGRSKELIDLRLGCHCEECRWYTEPMCGLYKTDKDKKGFCDEGVRRSV